MEDFFKHFRENMERRPEPAYEEKDWQALQPRLDLKGKKHRPIAIAWWWPILPLFLLSASNLLFFKELKMAKQQIVFLENRHDTVFVERVSIRTDTIYKTRTLRETRVEYLPAQVSAQAGIGLLEQGLTVADPFGPVAKSFVLNKTNDTPPFRVEPASQIGFLEKIKYPGTALLVLPTSVFPEIVVPDFVFNKKKTLSQQLYALRPKDFSLVANGGWLRPLGGGIEKGTGFSLGLEGRVGFSPRLALWVGATYANAMVEVVKMDESLGFPALSPPSDEFGFVGAEARQRSWLYTAGMQYAVINRPHWMLWAGAGYGAVQVLPYHATYDFVNAAGLEWSVEGQTLSPGWKDNYLMLRLGYERKMTRHLSAQFTANWRTRLGAEVLRPANLLGLGVGLVYRL